MKQKYSQEYLKKKLDKLKRKLGRYNLSRRYYRDTSNKKERDQMDRVFRKFKNKNVLDVGCHIGYYALLISSFANNVLGIDVSEKEIKRANYFKKMVDSNNTKFIFYSAFDLNDEFMEQNKIDAVFFHKMSEPRKTKLEGTENTWSDEKYRKVFSLFEKYCDIIICNDKGKIEKYIRKTNVSIKEYPSYRHNYLYIAKIKEKK